MRTIEELTAKNDKLRLLLASSKADCAYCDLPAAKMAECASGFPGCARADDMLLDGTPTRKEIVAERDALAGQNLELRGALERLIAETDSPDAYMLEVHAAERALSLPLPAAAERVRVEREFCEAYTAFEAIVYDDTGETSLRWLKAKRAYHELVSNPYQMDDGAARGADGV